MSSSKVTQTLIAPSSSSEHDSGASSDAPIIMSFPIKGSVLHLLANLSVCSYPSDSESIDPPAQNCVFTFSHERITEASIPRISPLPCVYGPFRVWRVLSKGGFATAMGAEDITSNRLICLKAFRKDRLKLKHTEGVLFNELDVYKHLASSSPRPASMFLMGLEMAFQTTEAICFAMDLMACDLNTCMRARPEYCSKNARRWTVQVAHGINALHEMGIIHRDIKPGNILIDTRQNVRVTDFGLSYLHKGPLEPQGAYTVDVVGTKGYTAPEILYNKTSPGFMMYGAAVDWWALGCVVFELLSEGHQGLFDTEEDFWDFVCLRSTPGMTYSDFPAFKGLPYDAVSLIGGLLDPAPFRRYVFQQLADHPCFSDESGASVFVDPYSHALRRKEKPHILPDLRRGRETHTAQIWDPNASWEDPARVANVDWIKKPFVSVS
ncbi:kinase-like domain-containing protein [Suillus lakei]|nr:kinase-like domain-containing protein [Suillus lakei]